MKYTYYPGCSVNATANIYRDSITAIAPALGLELEELEDWNCCGATAYMSVKELMSFSMGRQITTRQIPSNFYGRRFDELFTHYREKEGAMLIGVISESKKLSIDDFLSEDPSSIDDFIKRKFAESEKDLFADTGGKLGVLINPGWDYTIKEDERALVIGETKARS